jgi:hypothetical protein
VWPATGDGAGGFIDFSLPSVTQAISHSTTHTSQSQHPELTLLNGLFFRRPFTGFFLLLMLFFFFVGIFTT